MCRMCSVYVCGVVRCVAVCVCVLLLGGSPRVWEDPLCPLALSRIYCGNMRKSTYADMSPRCFFAWTLNGFTLD